MIYFVLFIVVVALAFDFINGFHDSANSIATIVGTRVLSPLAAVIWAAVFNFAALFFIGTKVAKAFGGGFIDMSIVDSNVILGGLLGAIIWNLFTWWFGIPSSSSHALIGGYAGAAVAKAGFGALLWGTKWIQTLSFIVLSPTFGMIAGFVLMVLVFNLFRTASNARVDKFFRVAQLTSSALLSLAHGGNDAQKTMGIIVALLVASQSLFAAQTGWLHQLYLPNMDTIPLWVEVSAYGCISLGTLFGGWRIDVERFLEFARDARPGAALSLPGQQATHRGARIVLGPEPARMGADAAPSNAFRFPLSIPGEVTLSTQGWAVSAERLEGSAGTPWTARGPAVAVAAAPLNLPLAIRSRRAGDRFRPLGLGGRGKKLQDFLVDRKIPREMRDSLPLVVDGHDKIVWVVGESVAEDFRVTEPSQGVILLKARRLGGLG